jgi:hypothetical protein
VQTPALEELPRFALRLEVASEPPTPNRNAIFHPPRA